MGKKKIAWRRVLEKCGSDISNAVIATNVNQYSGLGAPHCLLINNEVDSKKELSSMGFFCNYGPFPCLCNNDSDDDNETNELALMGKSESKNSKEKID